MFEGRSLLIATNHKKEIVIAPLLEKELGVNCIVATSINTDEFGTFAGDIERKNDPITTAKNKCFKAMEIMNCDLAIASEGSFGSHPYIFFAPADEEFLVFIDKKNDLEIISRELSTETNFNGQNITSISELENFAKNSDFPSHGLILRKSITDFTSIHKGITDWKTLYEVYNQLIINQETVYIETDMRAMYNPSRMKVIAKATQKLVEKIKNHCPKCNTSGFSVTDAIKGLPCEQCRFPTRSISSYIYCCQKCNFTHEKKFPEGKKSEDPMYCDNCNP